jgi:hypothetical protein
VIQPHYTDDLVTLYHGDCLDVLRELPDASVDAVVTDPPYELGFMGKGWDASGIAYDVDLWRDVRRVLKPGGHLLAFGGTRTWHRLACAIEDAGFEVRDSIAWMYGSGFPKSLDVSKAIDKAAGAERERQEPRKLAKSSDSLSASGFNADGWAPQVNTPVTPDAERWQGWGTALKPAHEPVVVARKPLIGTVAANVLAHGTGALNVDGCRVESGSDYHDLDVTQGGDHFSIGSDAKTRGTKFTPSAGRWPANVVLDEYAAAVLDEQSGERPGMGRGPLRRGATTGRSIGGDSAFGTADAFTAEDAGYNDTGGASRFFYTAKASTDERPRVDGIAHPTVKPLDLMRWLVRLVTPPGGVVLEPFAGSGTTLEACVIEGFHAIGIEREADYIRLIEARLTKPIQPDMFGGVA